MKSFKQLFAEYFYPLLENNNDISAEYDAIFGDDSNDNNSKLADKKYDIADDYNAIFGDKKPKKTNSAAPEKKIIKFPGHLWKAISVLAKKVILKQYRILLTDYSNKVYPAIWEILSREDKEKIKDAQLEFENMVHHNRIQRQIAIRQNSIAHSKENNGNAYRRHKYY